MRSSGRPWRGGGRAGAAWRWLLAAAALCRGCAAAVPPAARPWLEPGAAGTGPAAGTLPRAPAPASLLGVAATLGASPQQLSLVVVGVAFLLLSACALVYCAGECILHRRSGAARAPAPAADARPAAPGPAAGGLVLVEALAATLLDAPAPGAPAAGAAPGAREEGATTVAANRDRFAQNQSAVARQMLLRALPIFVCTVLLKLTISIAGLVFYITGCVTWFQTRGVPCDQPLQWWLLVALVTPILHKQTCQHDGTSSSFHKIVLAMELVYVVMGAWLLFSCSTCSDTNSRLYNFVAYYLAYKVLARSLLCFTSCGMMTLMFFIARRGLLDSSHGGMAARPGFVEEIETVDFSPDLFSDGQDDYKQPPECCVCQESFGHDRVIKRTVCGHFFHKDCLGEWLEKYSKSCPLCRRELDEGDGKLPAGAARPAQ